MLGMTMMKRSKVAMQVAGAEMDYLQTRMCNEGILAVEVNRAALTLEKGGTVVSKTSNVECSLGEDRPPVPCEVEIIAKGSVMEKGCYDLSYYKTLVGMKSSCGEGGTQRSVLEENVSLGELPLYQFALFWDGPLGLAPGPDMFIRGKMHSNDNITMRPAKNMNLHDWVTAVGLVLISQRNHGSNHFALLNGSGPDFANPVTGPDDTFRELKTIVSDWEDFRENHRVAYGEEGNGCGPVQKLSVPVDGPDGARSLIEWRNPDVDDERMKVRKLAWRASLIYKDGIWLNGTENLAIPAPHANTLAQPTVPAGWLMKGILRVTINDLANNRLIHPIPVDMARLQARSASDSIIYLYDDFQDPVQGNAQAGGFLLYNGGALLRPLTIVSNNRIFVLGDYNTTAGYALPEGGMGYFPAAIMADHLTHLSNHYTPAEHDELGEAYGSSVFNVAGGVTFHLNACLTVGAPRGPSGHVIGPLNFTQYMEDLIKIKHRRTGSHTSLFGSKHVEKDAANGVVFRPPDRDIAFDPMYTNMANMPPGTPRVVTPTLVDWELVR